MNVVPGTRIHGGGGGRSWAAAGTYRDDDGRGRSFLRFDGGASTWRPDPDDDDGAAEGATASPRANANTGATATASRVGCHPPAPVVVVVVGGGGGGETSRASIAARNRFLAPSVPTPIARKSSSVSLSSASNVSLRSTATGANDGWSTA
eukprot:31056-Pelagococcus_subviridis.AAC.9